MDWREDKNTALSVAKSWITGLSTQEQKWQNYKIYKQWLNNMIKIV